MVVFNRVESMCPFKGLKSIGGGGAISNAALVQFFYGAGELSPWVARVDIVIPWAQSGGWVKDCFARRCLYCAKVALSL